MHDHIDQLSKARRYFWIANRWLGLQISLIGIAFTMGTGIILLYSGHNLVDPALFGFVFTFSTKLSGICFKVVNSFGAFESSVAAAEKIIACANLEPEYQDGEDAPSDWPLTGKIEVRNLAARYSDTLPFVLDNINFTVEPGQRIGIVGRTGAGKSTLALSLLRLIQVQQGTIHIDGLDISTLRLDCLRSKIGFIPQDPALFSGTIRSNLDPARRHADSALENSLRRVRLKLSLDSSVEIGGNTLSHGQRQLLCLARLFLEDHKIIILDEATSAVDNEADMAIQDMLRFSSQQTLIVIAHRLQTVATFEKFLVMEDGKVTEQGSPYELLKAKGAYWRLVVGSVSMEQGSQAYTDGRTRQRKKLGKTIDGK